MANPRPDVLMQKHSSQCFVNNKYINRGTAFTHEERESYGLRGSMPAQVSTLELQVERALSHFRGYTQPIHKWVNLHALQERNIVLFYRLLVDNLEECMPIVYTPTVGEACLRYSQMWRGTHGLFITPRDKGSIRKVLDTWQEQVDICVVTDGSRILGLGDLGANGMGIPVGKLSLYVAAAGFRPSSTLPIMFDMGTNNEELRNDPLYIGHKEPRLTGHAYDEMVEEFMLALQEKWPGCLLQFEDFSNDHAFRLLDNYRHRLLSFNDDIQGTGAVIASGFINAAKLSGRGITEHTFVFLGAGSAGIGVASAITKVLVANGMSLEAARHCFYFVDSKGLITTTRGDTLSDQKAEWAHDIPENASSLLEIVKLVKPTALIGLSGQGGAFTQEVIEALAAGTEHPIIFPLSNPTSKAECTAEQAYTWSNGQCIFASGSPFDPVHIGSKTYYPSQGNNMYVFPGLGFGAVKCKASEVTDAMIVAATMALAEQVSPEDLAQGRIYPPLSSIREISVQVAGAVIKQALEDGTSDANIDDPVAFARDQQWFPAYTLPVA